MFKGTLIVYVVLLSFNIKFYEAFYLAAIQLSLLSRICC